VAAGRRTDDLRAANSSYFSLRAAQNRRYARLSATVRSYSRGGWNPARTLPAARQFTARWVASPDFQTAAHKITSMSFGDFQLDIYLAGARV
jgi:hypothetical protein